MATTLATLRTEVRDRADMPSRSDGGGFVTDAELTRYLNQGLAELHSLLVRRYETYFHSIGPTFTLGAGESAYSLPDDFFKLVALQRQTGSTWYDVPQFNRAEWNQIHGWDELSLPTNGEPVWWTLYASNVVLVPAESAPGTYRFWYVTKHTDLASDSDEVSLPVELQRFYSYAVVYAVIQCIAKEEGDVGFWAAELQRIKQEIQSSASNRQAGPQRVADVRGARSPAPWRRGRVWS